MALPSNRTQFKEYIMRRLGAPVLNIDVDEDQVEDRIDDALKYYWDYHFDGTEKIYYKHQITQDNMDQQFIIMPENIIGAVRIFEIGVGSTSAGFFSIQYQIALNDLYTLTSQSMVPYAMAMFNLAQMEQLLVGQKPIRYNRNRNVLYVDMNWNNVKVGDYLVVEAYQVVDPESFPDVWSDRWLLEYATSLVQRQWGQHLTKFVGQQMPGGVMFNGDRILSDAQAKISELEHEMINSYSLPVTDMIG